MKKILTIFLTIALLLSITACGSSEAKKVDLESIYEEFQSILPDMLILDEATMLNFLGVEADDCTQVITAVCANGLRTDEVWLIEAKDAAALERLTTLVESRITAKKEETISYSPDQYAVVEKAEVITNDLYLALLISPDVDTLKTTFEAAFN